MVIKLLNFYVGLGLIKCPIPQTGHKLKSFPEIFFSNSSGEIFYLVNTFVFVIDLQSVNFFFLFLFHNNPKCLIFINLGGNICNINLLINSSASNSIVLILFLSL